MWVEVRGQIHVSAALLPEKNPGNYWRLGGPQRQPGLSGKEKKQLAPIGIRARNLHPVVQSLHKLRYLCSYISKISKKNMTAVFSLMYDFIIKLGILFTGAFLTKNHAHSLYALQNLFSNAFF
jgi:hypothetical protein